MTVVAAFIVFVVLSWVAMALFFRGVKDGQRPLEDVFRYERREMRR